MSFSNHTRLAGLAAMASGVLFIVGDLLGLTTDDSLRVAALTTSFVIQHLLYLLSAALLMGGLIGLYVRQSEVAGILGVVGFFVAFLGTALAVGAFWARAYIARAYITPTLAEMVPAILTVLSTSPPWGSRLASVTFGLGWLLFGGSALRARVYPRTATILLTIGAAITLLPFVPLRFVVFGVGVVWLGFFLFSERGEQVR